MRRFYYYSSAHLNYQPLSWGKLTAAVVSIMLIVPVATTALGFFGVDLFGVRELCAASVANENSVLRANLASLNDKLGQFKNAMDALQTSDDEMRLQVNMKPIPTDIRKVAVGGVEINSDYGVSLSANKLISEIKNNLQVLDRQAQLQRQSYADILARYKTNQVLFMHIPAIDPIRDGRETDGFGMRFHPILHMMLMHEGIDIACDVGTHVHATGDGIVRFVGRRGGYGNAVVIDNGFGYSTLFGHLSKPLVHVGQHVKRGQVIALSGDTGLSTGPHLHYEVRKNGIHVDPNLYFFNGSQFHTAKFYSTLVQE